MVGEGAVMVSVVLKKEYMGVGGLGGKGEEGGWAGAGYIAWFLSTRLSQPLQYLKI